MKRAVFRLLVRFVVVCALFWVIFLGGGAILFSPQWFVPSGAKPASRPSIEKPTDHPAVSDTPAKSNQVSVDAEAEALALARQEVAADLAAIQERIAAMEEKLRMPSEFMALLDGRILLRGGGSLGPGDTVTAGDLAGEVVVWVRGRFALVGSRLLRF